MGGLKNVKEQTEESTTPNVDIRIIKYISIKYIKYLIHLMFFA